MKFKIKTIFRYSSFGNSEVNNFPDYYSLTKGKNNSGVGTGGKGIFSYAPVIDLKDGAKRIPAIILHSNPYKEGSDTTPWVDEIDADKGYALYNGDNKSNTGASSSSGNKMLLDIYHQYLNANERIYAPPILLFRQEVVFGKKKGYRSFQGYGIPVNIFIRTQQNKEGVYFTNLVFELALFNLNAENDNFNWDWIDDRRDQNLSATECLKNAPATWRKWVEEGVIEIEKLKRSVSKYSTIKKSEQLNMDDEGSKILRNIYDYYTKKKHSFEGLAIAVASDVIGDRYKKGWVTKRSGDGGVDFVGRLDVGSGFSLTKLVVLGQAKCIEPASGVSGHDISRLVARLQRGWIGVFVTTGYFTEYAQKELLEDKYPIILINGKRLVSEIKKKMNIENIELKELLDTQSEWYKDNIQPFETEDVLDEETLTQYDLSLVRK